MQRKKSVFVVGEHTENPSEGMQVITAATAEALEQNGFSVRRAEAGRPIKTVLLALALRPAAVVFTHGPGRGVLLCSVLLRFANCRCIIWIASRPDLGCVPRLLRNRRSAHLIVANPGDVQFKDYARDARVETRFIGIDTSRFQEFGPWPWPELSPTTSVLLHVGHVRTNRGLSLLREIQRKTADDAQVVVVVGSRFAPDPEELRQLLDAGVMVITGYVPQIGTMYRHAALYIWPVSDADGGAVDLPQSVLEALASGCPVVAVDFGALSHALGDADGVTITNRARFVEEVCSQTATASRARGSGLPEHLRLRQVVEVVAEEILEVVV